MKKILSILLLFALVLSLSACGSVKTSETASGNGNESEQSMIGGWTRPDSPAVTDEVKELMEKALEDLVGMDYIPVAYIGTQVVAGTNHAILCRVKAVTPDAAETYAIVYLYEDLEGNVEITEVKDFGAQTNINDLDGGWSQADAEVSEEAKAAFEEATGKMIGADYDLIALVSTQVVSGMNYCFLCTVRAVSPEAEARYALVYVYQDVQGEAKVTDVVEMPEEETEEETVGIANPFEDCMTMEEAAAIAGFDMTVPASVEGYGEGEIQAVVGEMIQVFFAKNDSRLLLRKAVGDEDISGDYTVYEESRLVSAGDCEVTMKGNGGTVNVAIWTAEGYTYAVVCDEAMSVETMTALVSQIG